MTNQDDEAKKAKEIADKEAAEKAAAEAAEKAAAEARAKEEEAAKAKKHSEPIAYEFKPRNPGEYLMGVPQRDLTQAEFDALQPEAQRNATYGTDALPAMYQPVKK